MDDDAEILTRWTNRLSGFVAPYLERSPAMRPIADRCAAVLHGSTTFGIDDAFSDLDVWLFAPQESVQKAEAIAGTGFISFVLNNKPGHFNLEPMEAAEHWLRDCDLELIAELRRSRIVHENGNFACELLAAARRPMRDAVRRAWFGYHYVEMRGFHRNCDNPIERGHSVAVLQGLVPTINHALRAAMVLDGMPYPYIKWLASAAASTSTGGRVLPLVQDLIDLLSTGALCQPGPEKSHPLSKKLREIRGILVESARAAGIDEPWLDRWWEYIPQARQAIKGLAW